MRPRMSQQTTVAAPVRLEGVGLHHGGRATLSIEPAEANTGLVFFRSDCGVRIPALQQFRGGMVHASRLGHAGATVDTPEHLLAALYALGVDNAQLLIDGPEVPILDGSALPIAQAILQAGLRELPAARGVLVVTQTVSVGDDLRRLEIQPWDGFRLTAGIDFEHSQLGYQELTVRLDYAEDFLHKLAPARTFALRRDVEKLRAAGLAQGGSLDNAILVDDEGLKGIDLRFQDEFVRHKLLDLVGDLALLGCPIRGRVMAWRSGHELHGRLVDALLADRSAWVFESGTGGPEAPPSRPTPPGQTSH
ncbi:MAG: UDP-3-O-acyl-N-acetylglucosamine deacetylase [Acidobacteriota bacterium]